MLVVVLSLIGISTPYVQAVVGNRSTGGGPSGNAGHAFRQAPALTNGLVGWWKMDGDATDSSGQGNNGALTNFNGDATDGYVDGKFGKGLLMDGSNDYLTAGDVLDPGINDFSVSVWVKPASTALKYIYVKGLEGGGPGHAGFDMYIASGAVFTEFSDGSAQGITASTPNGTLEVDKWYNLVATYSRSGNMVTYINGVQKSSISISSQNGNSDTNKPLAIGTFANLNAYFFDGVIDDVRVYNRILSGSEITQLYQGSQPTNCDQTCLGWWKLDETSGTTATDNSGHGNNGTYTNGPALNLEGVFGSGVAFDGSNDGVSIPDSPSLNVGSGDLTLSAWIKISSMTNQYQSVIVKGLGNRAYSLAINSGAANIVFTQGFSAATMLLTQNLVTNTWYHLAITRDATTSVLYLNGVQQSTTAVVSRPDTSETLEIGTGGAGFGYFSGNIDDARVYNRALQPYEIYEMYSAGR